MKIRHEIMDGEGRKVICASFCVWEGNTFGAGTGIQVQLYVRLQQGIVA